MAAFYNVLNLSSSPKLVGLTTISPLSVASVDVEDSTVRTDLRAHQNVLRILDQTSEDTEPTMPDPEDATAGYVVQADGSDGYELAAPGGILAYNEIGGSIFLGNGAVGGDTPTDLGVLTTYTNDNSHDAIIDLVINKLMVIHGAVVPVVTVELFVGGVSYYAVPEINAAEGASGTSKGTVHVRKKITAWTGNKNFTAKIYADQADAILQAYNSSIAIMKLP